MSDSHVAIYLRISHDPNQTNVGVDRQRVDCTAIARIRWPDTPVVEYVDNDLSAYSGVKRPGYTALTAALSAGSVRGVVAWNLDRLLRQPRDLEHLIDLGTPIVTAQGDLDLTSHDGQLHARILAAVAKKSSDDTSRRVARAAKDRATAGLFHGGRHIPYGYRRGDSPGHLVVDPESAAVVRSVAARVLSGEKLHQIIPTLPATDLRQPRAREGWRLLLTGPIIRGRNSAGHPAVWPAIIDPQTGAALHAALAKHSRTRPNKTWPLSAIARCGKCAGKLYGCVNHGHPHYFCRTCHGTSIAARPFEQFVAAALDAAVIVAPVERVVQRDEDLEQKLAIIMQERINGDITDIEWRQARAAIIDATSRTPAPRAEPLPPGSEWQRLVVVEHIVVGPAVHRGPVFTPSRIGIVWKE